jgi:PII-like signaling protein
MNDECVKLTTYFGERDRANGGFLADALLDCYGRHGFQTSVLLRGVLGFGIHHHLRTDRLLTLSEDLPMISVAVDTRARVEAALPEVRELTTKGLVTLERARLLTEHLSAADAANAGADQTKLTIYVGRKHRIGRAPAYVAIVDLLHRHGVAGATVLLGVDGTLHGDRQRAAFFGRNADVPLMIIAIGDTNAIGASLDELDTSIDEPLATIERVRTLKRDGQRLADPHHLSGTDPTGLNVWQKLMIYTGEQSRHDGHPIYQQLVRRLRQQGSAGATSVRGIWGYHGNHAPHGDRFFSIARHVPVITAIVDTPDRIRDLYSIVDELTDSTGLVTSELVPAFRAVGTGIRRGGLQLAQTGEANRGPRERT